VDYPILDPTHYLLAKLAVHYSWKSEVRRSNGELYGFERLTTLFEHLPTAESIAATARSFGQDDDITVLTIQRLRLDQRVADLSTNFP